jgi:hypothetical protein
LHDGGPICTRHLWVDDVVTSWYDQFHMIFSSFGKKMAQTQLNSFFIPQLQFWKPRSVRWNWTDVWPKTVFFHWSNYSQYL